VTEIVPSGNAKPQIRAGRVNVSPQSIFLVYGRICLRVETETAFRNQSFDTICEPAWKRKITEGLLGLQFSVIAARIALIEATAQLENVSAEIRRFYSHCFADSRSSSREKEHQRCVWFFQRGRERNNLLRFENNPVYFRGGFRNWNTAARIFLQPFALNRPRKHPAQRHFHAPDPAVSLRSKVGT
jgi:hypothetical protein